MRYLNAKNIAYGEDRRVYSTVDSTATTNQTVFAVNYEDGKVSVYKNGERLVPEVNFTYTLSGVGTQITLLSGIAENDYLEVEGSLGLNTSRANIDTHLNTSSATSSQILSYSGSEYQWVDNATGGGGGGSGSANEIQSPVSAEVTTAIDTDGQVLLLGDTIAFQENATLDGGQMLLGRVVSDLTVSDATFIVTVSNPGPGEALHIDASYKPALSLMRGKTYTFDQSDSSNTGHTIAFKNGSGEAYTNGVTTTGTAGSSGAKTVFDVPADAPDNMSYYCVAHGDGEGNELTIYSINDQTLTNKSGSSPTISGTGEIRHAITLTDATAGPPLFSADQEYSHNVYDSQRVGYQLVILAEDPDGGSVTYALAEGTLPDGMTLSSSTGIVSGTPTAQATDTTFAFTITATDDQGSQSTSATFSITVKAPVAQTFAYTGDMQTFDVPSWMTSVTAYAWGAGGGGGAPGGLGYGDNGGSGGSAYGVINTSSLTQLGIVVGEGGQGQDDTVTTTIPATYGGGAEMTGTTDNRYGGGAGGLSGIFSSNDANYTQAGAILIAGGGGGGGSHRSQDGNCAGGAGGGLESQHGQHNGSWTGAHGGNPATQTEGGSASGGSIPGAAGSALQGGTSGAGQYGGAGAGGYFGGGGGGHNPSPMGGGAGGSGYANSTYVTNETLETGDGVTAGNHSHSYRGLNAIGGGPQSNGGNGVVVLVY